MFRRSRLVQDVLDASGMTKLAILTVLVTACGARSTAPVSPAQRSQAIHLYLDGASDQEIAATLACGPDQAHAVLHDAIVELNRKFYRR